MGKEIRAKVTVDGSAFKRGLDALKDAAHEFASELKSEFASGLGAIAGVAALIENTKEAFEHFAQIGEMAAQFNMTAESVQRLGYAAEQSGMSMETMGKGMRQMQARMAEAATQAGPARDAWKAAGVTLEELKSKGLDSEEALGKLADAVSHAKTHTDALQIVTGAFGRRMGSEMIPMLMKGKEGLEELKAKAHVMSGGMVESLKQSEDSIKEWKDQMQLAFGYIAIGLKVVLKVVNVFVVAFVNYWNQMYETVAGFAHVIKTSFTNGFSAAKTEFINFNKRMEELARDGAKNVTDAWGEISEAWHPKAEPKVGGAMDVEVDDHDAEAKAKKLEEARQRLAEEKARADEAEMTRLQKIEDLRKRINDTMAEANRLGVDTLEGINKMTEAEKLRAELNSQLKEQSEEEKRKNEAQQKAHEHLEEAKEKANEAGMTKSEKLDDMKRRQSEMFSRADKETDPVKRDEIAAKAWDMTGEITSLQKELNKPHAVTADSLAQKGLGGFTSKSGGTDLHLREAQRTNSILEQILHNSRGGHESGHHDAAHLLNK